MFFHMLTLHASGGVDGPHRRRAFSLHSDGAPVVFGGVAKGVIGGRSWLVGLARHGLRAPTGDGTAAVFTGTHAGVLLEDAAEVGRVGKASAHRNTGDALVGLLWVGKVISTPCDTGGLDHLVEAAAALFEGAIEAELGNAEFRGDEGRAELGELDELFDQGFDMDSECGLGQQPGALPIRRIAFQARDQQGDERLLDSKAFLLSEPFVLWGGAAAPISVVPGLWCFR